MSRGDADTHVYPSRDIRPVGETPYSKSCLPLNIVLSVPEIRPEEEGAQVRAEPAFLSIGI